MTLQLLHLERAVTEKPLEPFETVIALITTKEEIASSPLFVPSFRLVSCLSTASRGLFGCFGSVLSSSHGWWAEGYALHKRFRRIIPVGGVASVKLPISLVDPTRFARATLSRQDSVA